ncbi:MAG: hypothetical protein A3G75_00475, partial [Verrucomicrobia bacterium RIFCSPLOWO2_12_FULL_64_8]
YVLALDGETVIGSMAIRMRRPFSLDEKIPNLDAHLPANRNFCEVRLLNIAREHRSGRVLPGMLSVLTDYAIGEKIDGALISATTRQLQLYSHLGFVPFGPLVGTADAPFQPMYLTLEVFRERLRKMSSFPPAARGEVVSLLSGPVAVHDDVRAAFHSPPRSHRSPSFEDEVRDLKARLRALANANHVEILLGSGTLANDAVAAQLALLGGRGIVVSNGEFGERLADHAQRARLDFEHLRFEWGEPIDVARIGNAAWVWLTACETSAGILNDVAAIGALCRENGAKLALDCVSAVGAVPIDLQDVWLATGASGKGLASYPGLSLVFHHDPIGSSDHVPRYLDLGLYARNGVPFTHSSNLVQALNVAVGRVDWSKRFSDICTNGTWLRARLRAAGCSLVGERATPAPHVLTVQVPSHVRSDDVANVLERTGYIICHASGYLRERNWIQICLMGEVARESLPPLVRAIARACR